MKTKLNVSEKTIISNLIMLGYSLNDIEKILITLNESKSFIDSMVNIIYHSDNNDYSIMEYQ